MEADSVEDLYRVFMTSMRKDFGVDHACMILYGENTGSEGYRTETQENASKEIGSLFLGHKPVSGTLRKEELTYLFPEAGETGSAALMPLANGAQLGLIAVGSTMPTVTTNLWVPCSCRTSRMSWPGYYRTCITGND